MLKRIAITGPESTGKTRLTEELARHFQTNAVPEFARSYLESFQAKYTVEDLLEIAKGQLKGEEEMAEKSEGLLFCDTDFTVLKIWSEEVFSFCPEWIQKTFDGHIYDLYLLCYPDIDWEADPLRENPKNRMFLFERYQSVLKKAGFNFAIVKGRGGQRLKNAINFVEQLDFDSGYLQNPQLKNSRA